MEVWFVDRVDEDRRETLAVAGSEEVARSIVQLYKDEMADFLKKYPRLVDNTEYEVYEVYVIEEA